MKNQIEILTSLLLVCIILLTACDNNKMEQVKPIGLTTIERLPPQGETPETGHWMAAPPDNRHEKTWWHRTAPIEEYDKYGIAKQIPTDEKGNSYLTIDNLPVHLKQRLSDVEAGGNTYSSNPNYYQEVYNTLCGGLKPKIAAKFFLTYNLYNSIALKHMDDAQAFHYILRTAEGHFKGVNAEAYAKRIFAKEPKSQIGYEAGMYLCRNKDIDEREIRLREVLKHHPNSARTLYLLSTTLIYHKDELKTGLKYLKKAHQYEDQERWNLTLSDTYERLGDHEKALFHIKGALKHNPINQDSIFKLIVLETNRAEDDPSLLHAFSAYYFDAVGKYWNRPGYNHPDIDPLEMRKRAISNLKQAIELGPDEVSWKKKLEELQVEHALD
ncbi:hypothetical protein JT359_19945 [Candidatus Poribacteria bacterium]|nr:hypothetical protein [Candidatus Poribacteria bacterium]